MAFTGWFWTEASATAPMGQFAYDGRWWLSECNEPEVGVYVLGWPKCSFGFCCNVLRKNQNKLFGQPNNSQGRIVPPPKQFRNVPSNIHVGKKNLSRTSPCWSYKHKIFLHILAWLECSRKALLWKSNEDYTTYCLDWPRVVCHFEKSYDQQQHRSRCLSCITSVRSSACRLPNVSVHRFKQMTTSWSFGAVKSKYMHAHMLINS